MESGRAFSAVVLLAWLSGGCSGGDRAASGTGTPSCPGLGTLELTVGSHEGTSSVDTLVGSPSSTFLLLTEDCSGDATGSLYDIPSTLGTHSFTVPTSGSGALASGPNLTIGVPGPDYTIGFDSVLDCTPCGSGTITILESDDTHVSGTIEGVAVQVVGGPGGLSTNPSASLPVTGAFEANWEK